MYKTMSNKNAMASRSNDGRARCAARPNLHGTAVETATWNTTALSPRCSRIKQQTDEIEEQPRAACKRRPSHGSPRRRGVYWRWWWCSGRAVALQPLGALDRHDQDAYCCCLSIIAKVPEPTCTYKRRTAGRRYKRRRGNDNKSSTVSTSAQTQRVTYPHNETTLSDASGRYTLRQSHPPHTTRASRTRPRSRASSTTATSAPIPVPPLASASAAGTRGCRPG